MRSVHIAYGSGTLAVDVPDDSRVLLPLSPPGLSDPAAAITSALRRPIEAEPLLSLVRADTKVAVVFPDITRPMPNRTVLPPLLAELERLGAGPDHVTLLCATGSHRTATDAEMDELVGSDLTGRYPIRQHVATDGNHVQVGQVDGYPILLDRAYVEADLRITTGFVEPHFFAGFSGGPKAVCPGLAALETIMETHSPARIGDPSATWLELDANPVHRFITQAVSFLPPDLSVDVALNEERELAAVFAGSLPTSHRQACDFVRATAVHFLSEPCDVVITSNGGLPLDRNLYQAVKGMAAAERVVRPGGDIVLCSSCIDGIPMDGGFGEILRRSTTVEDLASPPAQLDSWQVQVLGRVLEKATVHVFSEGLTDEEIRMAHLRPVEDPSRLVDQLLRRHGPDPTVCVLPEGPLTVATLTG